MSNLSEIIRRKFHGFSDKQWEELKDKFPYSEIPFIINEVLQQPELSPELKQTGHHREWKFCPGCAMDWEPEIGADQVGCWNCGFTR